jgi:hypothetical protein
MNKPIDNLCLQCPGSIINKNNEEILFTKKCCDITRKLANRIEKTKLI